MGSGDEYFGLMCMAKFQGESKFLNYVFLWSGKISGSCYWFWRWKVNYG